MQMIFLLQRHPKMDLNKADLLRLLSYLEGELQARDIAIATMKVLLYIMVTVVSSTAHLSQGVKRDFLIRLCPLSVSFVVSFSHFHLLS